MGKRSRPRATDSPLLAGWLIYGGNRELLFLIRVGRTSTSLDTYFTYYLAWVFFSYALRTPWLLLGLMALLVFCIARMRRRHRNVHVLGRRRRPELIDGPLSAARALNRRASVEDHQTESPRLQPLPPVAAIVTLSAIRDPQKSGVNCRSIGFNRSRRQSNRPDERPCRPTRRSNRLKNGAKSWGLLNGRNKGPSPSRRRSESHNQRTSRASGRLNRRAEEPWAHSARLNERVCRR